MSETDNVKAYESMFTCMFTQAIHLDIAAEYSTEQFSQAFRRLTLVRGTPEFMVPDSGNQLISAKAIIQSAMRHIVRKHAKGASKDTR